MPAGGGMTSARTLREPLEHFYREFDYRAGVESDATRLPPRCPDPPDRELAVSLAACLASGRVDLFGPQLDGVLAVMGPSPAAFVVGFDPRRDARAFESFWYRFNRPRDLVAFCVAARDQLGRYGTLEKLFLAGDPDPAGPIGPALERFARSFLEADLREGFPRGRRSRGYRHLFPLPSAVGPGQRPHLFLRRVGRPAPPAFDP